MIPTNGGVLYGALGLLVRALQDGPRSTRELGISAQEARDAEQAGAVTLDPDEFPDEYVPGNPLVVRIPGDDRPWPGWKRWRR